MVCPLHKWTMLFLVFWCIQVSAAMGVPTWTMTDPIVGSSYTKTSDIAGIGACTNGEGVTFALKFIKANGSAFQTVNGQATASGWGATLTRPLDEEENPINWPVYWYMDFFASKIRVVPASGTITSPTGGEVRITITEQ